MSMSKQDFIALADTIRIANKYAAKHEEEPVFSPQALSALAGFCKSQNFAFMSGRWFSYIAGECEPNGGTIKPESKK
jgi:hypothetical protein